MKSIIYVGLDVHKATFSACCYENKNQSYFAQETFQGNTDQVLEYLKSVKESLAYEVEFQIGYEAGCRGYSLAKDLIGNGFSCAIMEPTTIDKPSDSGKKKTDRQDAMLLARALANNTYKKVHIPDDYDIMVKERIRMYHAHKKMFRQIKQEICALLLRHGKVYTEGKNYWTQKHRSWIKGFYSEPVFGKTLEEYMDTFFKYEDKIARLELDLVRFADEDRYRETVARICCLKGITKVTALTFLVEVGDFSRFESGKVFPAYLGIVPGDHSSGGKSGKLRITKLGNSILRRLAVECARACVKGTPGHKAKKQSERQAGCDVKTIAYADKGTERIQRRYRHLISREKNANKAVTACAREYVSFIWGLATMRYSDSF